MTTGENLKKRMAARDTTFGSWIQTSSTDVAEIMAKAGFDWLVVDMEHSGIGQAQAQELIRVIDLAGGTPLVRLTANDAVLIKRVMDAGARGIIVPNVCSRREAEAAVSAVMYPPRGSRGVGLWRAQGYGFEFDEYKHWLSEQAVVIVQIENITGVENFEEIMTTEGIDGFIIGPYDLSASLGFPGDFENALVRAALEQVKRLSANLHVLMGYHVVPPDPEKVRGVLAEGYRFLALSMDTFLLGSSARSLLDKARKA